MMTGPLRRFWHWIIDVWFTADDEPWTDEDDHYDILKWGYR